ncbi:MAG: UDP-glucose--hexose-1-phosphate uridylyltransferase [Lachnospiraceae bacterium]|jgi:UDPglucose--hexose-1-phosphate uridylyltransferase|nr:UDP-glucose--hexose-1-phosphate uridylyltransferase [Lachnospiraceae bacterium]MEE3460632.1 UDP-glucose--hexose-1-phosphate uridylyltransferase [Lachnospiraceae bacterium]
MERKLRVRNLSELIDELMEYALKHDLIDDDDVIWSVNKLLELFNTDEYSGPVLEGKIAPENPGRSLSDILDDMTDYAADNELIKAETLNERDLFDTRIMGMITPSPSFVRKRFRRLYKVSPERATDYYYDLSRATNYIRTDRVARDIKWVAETPFGNLDITINLSKPEKDPRDIAKAAETKSSAYPACLLCKENEGYAGGISHPARQNHRIIPIELGGEDYFLQYSPYVYYNEHCIVFNSKHTPMKIDKDTFAKLLEFVKLFPHYTLGSNADLPIVGGSILSHDHFQGGRYEFPMARAGAAAKIRLDGFDDLDACILDWPLSTIRLDSGNRKELVKAADNILQTWRAYTDEDAFIYAETNGVRHNTITPIARKRGRKYELDLVLRNNITTPEYPLGLYHPHQEYHHIKKENIGLIEVMGLAVLPRRLKDELSALEEDIINEKSLRDDPLTASHADWAEEHIIGRYDINSDNISDIVRKEVGIVFSHVLEDAGVFKRTEEGRKAFLRFIKSV